MRTVSDSSKSNGSSSGLEVGLVESEVREVVLAVEEDDVAKDVVSSSRVNASLGSRGAILEYLGISSTV